MPPRHREPPSPAFAEVRAILQQPWLVDVGEVNGLADQAHERAHLLDPFAASSGLILAGRNGFLVIARPDVGCGVSGLIPNVLMVRSSADDARLNLRVLHELAHAMLDKAHPHHDHADVWALSLALAIPRRVFRLHHLARHVPQWAVRLRRQTANVMPRAA